MLSTKKVYNLICEFVQYNAEYLEEKLGEDWKVDLMYDLTDDTFNPNLLLYREFNTEEELYDALEAEIEQLIKLDETEEVDDEKVEEQKELVKVALVNQQLLETVEEIEKEKTAKIVNSLNSLYYNLGGGQQTPKEEEEKKVSILWLLVVIFATLIDITKHYLNNRSNNVNITKNDIDKLLAYFQDGGWVNDEEEVEIREYLFGLIDENRFTVLDFETCFDEDFCICAPSTLWESMEIIKQRK